MEGPVLTAKLTRLFRVLDARKDGLLNKDDFKEIGARAIQIGGLNRQEAEHFVLTLGTGLWRKIIGVVGEDVSFTENGFIEHMRRRNIEVTEIAGQFNDYDMGWELCFECADFKKDGAITVTDLLKFFRILGVLEWVCPLVFVAAEGLGDGLLRPHDLQQAGRDFLRLDQPHATQILFGPIDDLVEKRIIEQSPLQVITEHWIVQMSRFYRILNIDKRTTVGLKDLEMFRRRVIHLARHKSDELVITSQRAMSRVWQWLLGAANDDIAYTQVEFITAVLRQLSIAKAEDFFGAVSVFFYMMFLACDISGGEKLGVAGLQHYYHILNIPQNANKALSQLDKYNTGFIQRQEFIEIGVGIFRSTKPNGSDWLLGCEFSDRSPSAYQPGPSSPRHKQPNDCAISLSWM